MIRYMNLDKVRELRNLKHADYIILTNNYVIIVEEVKGRPKLDDIEQLKCTLENLHRIPNLKDIELGNVKVVGVIHYRRRSDTLFNKLLVSEASRAFKKGFILKAISCKNINDLINKLKLL